MPIKKASELDFTNKKIKLIIAGYAGIGKTTLALSYKKHLQCVPIPNRFIQKLKRFFI
jgi:GTPase SAR1 family protein